jgi:hypothetical protein
MSVPATFTQTEIAKARDFLKAWVHTNSRIVNGKIRGNPYVTYGEVAAHMGYEIETEWDGDRVGGLVGEVSYMEHACGNPLLSVIVVIAATQTPGKGLFNLGRELNFIKESADQKEELSFWKNQTIAVVEKWGGHRP